MIIKVLFFAHLREVFGPSRSIECVEGTSAGEAISGLLGGRGASALPLRYAVNEQFEEPSRVLNEGDVVAVITPVAGG